PGRSAPRPSGDGLFDRLLERTALLRDVLLELVAEELDHAAWEPGRRITQRAERPAVDAVPDVEQQVDVARFGVARLEAVEQVRHPEGALAAGGALTAALVAEELHIAAGSIDHAGGLVHHDHCTSPRQR